MTCTHDLAERETACADGMCPICAAAEIERLHKDKIAWQDVAAGYHDEIERLAAANVELQRQKDYWQALAIDRALEPKP